MQSWVLRWVQFLVTLLVLLVCSSVSCLSVCLSVRLSVCVCLLAVCLFDSAAVEVHCENTGPLVRWRAKVLVFPIITYHSSRLRAQGMYGSWCRERLYHSSGTGLGPKRFRMHKPSTVTSRSLSTSSMSVGLSVCLPVCLSVCLSVWCWYACIPLYNKVAEVTSGLRFSILRQLHQ